MSKEEVSGKRNKCQVSESCPVDWKGMCSLPHLDPGRITSSQPFPQLEQVTVARGVSLLCLLSCLFRHRESPAAGGPQPLFTVLLPRRGSV